MNQVKAWRTALGEEEVKSTEFVKTGDKVGRGKLTTSFENKLAERLDVPFALATNSAGSALMMALRAHGVGSGDEVIVPNRATAAISNAVRMLGAKVKLVDVLPDRPLVDVRQVFSCLSAKTKALIAVHSNGRACNMEVLRQVADEYDLALLEDATQALFSKRNSKCLGTFGAAGCYSFGMKSLLPTGEGGLVVTQDKAVYEEMQQIRSKDRFGFTDLQAQMGLNQLTKIDKEIYLQYFEFLAQNSFVNIVEVDVESGEIPLFVEALCEEREALRSYLFSNNIETLAQAPSLSTTNRLDNKRELHNSEMYERLGLTLPGGPGADPETISMVLRTLGTFSEARRLAAA